MAETGGTQFTGTFHLMYNYQLLDQ